jgi:hypothetical protein
MPRKVTIGGCEWSQAEAGRWEAERGVVCKMEFTIAKPLKHSTLVRAVDAWVFWPADTNAQGVGPFSTMREAMRAANDQTLTQ